MKVRKDYVTNSSSSSYVIAKKDDCTVDEIKSALNTLRGDIKRTLKDYVEDYDDKGIDDFIDETARRLFSTANGLRLDDWLVAATTFDNESEAYEGFLYEFGGEFNTENFKMRWTE